MQGMTEHQLVIDCAHGHTLTVISVPAGMWWPLRAMPPGGDSLATIKNPIGLHNLIVLFSTCMGGKS